MRSIAPRATAAALLPALVLVGCSFGPTGSSAPTGAPSTSSAAPTSAPTTAPTTAPTIGTARQVRVSFSGGFDTLPEDHGRPVVLVASLLGVPPEVFRAAFRGVTPAGAGQEPDPAQVQRNKAALLQVLAPYGVTNDTLDQASNRYRYNGSAGEHWPTTPAAAVADVVDGKVTRITVTEAGSGYSSPPAVSVAGVADLHATAEVSYTTNPSNNGSIARIALA